jgi:hypothetical protein
MEMNQPEIPASDFTLNGLTFLLDPEAVKLVRDEHPG